jgi:hypothetical protein
MIDEQNKKRSLPFGLKFSARLRGVDPNDIQRELADSINSNKKSRTLRNLVMGGAGGELSKDSGPACNYNHFFSTLSKERTKIVL